MASSVFSRALQKVAAWLDHRYGWDRLSRPLGLLALAGIRETLRADNLVDTNTPGPPPTCPHGPPADTTVRSADGSYNDTEQPQMGAMESRFGRNVALSKAFPDDAGPMMEPNPRTLSRELMTREEFQPAKIINLLVAAWLQFMVHDWMSHGSNQTANPFMVALSDDDPWPYQRPMPIARTRIDPTRGAGDAGLPPTYTNTETHWWDASQVYGTNPPDQVERLLRTGEGGRLVLDANGLIPFDPTAFDGAGVDVAGVAGNWWLGLGILHSLFMQEHNAICAMLAAAYPSWSDAQLYGRARLINAALLAKIHTVEWTTAIITHPTSQAAMHINWYGVVPSWVRKFALPLRNEALTGIPGSRKSHDGAPYCLTEEFVAVYRMHPLIPDDYTLRSRKTREPVAQLSFRDIAGAKARPVLEGVGMADLLYSFGVSYPGAVCLHNFPRFLQDFVRPDGSHIDLAATDILRSRERGVPRYNEFRRLLHMKPFTSFEELAAQPAWAGQLAAAYGGDIEQVDATVGMFAEKPPAGFGFSDTAFRIFILMASRRLRSDRFFTTDFTPEVYTPEGFRWIAANNMRTVLGRHYPDLAPLVNPANAFSPWPGIESLPGPR